jgi:glycosyltransferase involved in cell wall biosynthesis
MPLRVLVISNLDSARPFGQFLRPFHLGRGLARQGHQVANVGVDCSSAAFGPTWSTGTKSLGRLMRLALRARREFHPDVIYAHELRPASAALLRPGGPPVVVDLHSLPSVEWRGYVDGESGRTAALYRLAGARAGLSERLIAHRADRVICAGANVRDRFAELYAQRVPTEVIVNGVEHELLTAPPAAENPYAGEPGDGHAVTTLPGAVTPSNDRARHFLEAVAEHLDRRGPQVTLHVLGADAPNGRSRIRFHGFQPDLWAWIDHADVCMLPYPPEAALCGGPRNKLLESLARGRAVVTTEEGTRGLEEVARWPGVHVAGDDPASFADALRLAAGQGAQGLEERREKMLARLEWDVLATDVTEVLAGAALRPRD